MTERTFARNFPQQTTTPSRGAQKSGRLADLQRMLGNRNVQRLAQTRALQAKLTVSQPGDAHEREADRVAEQVMCMPEKRPEDEEETLQAKHASPPAAIVAREGAPRSEAKLPGSEVSEVSSEVEQGIQDLRGRGAALPEPVRGFMESRFGTDFGAVRVHTSGHAAELARSVQAHAFTVGQDVVFATGQYAPETDGGKRLIAHELTHVLQQTSDTAPRSVQTVQSEGAAQAAKETEAAIVFVNPAPADMKLRRGLQTEPKHDGVDIPMPIGTSIKAAADGEVVHAGEINGYGSTIDISHGGKYTTRYAHLSEFKVSKGASVQSGQEIGLSGNTGSRTTGPHLHFEIRQAGRWGTPLNPQSFITFPA